MKYSIIIFFGLLFSCNENSTNKNISKIHNQENKIDLTKIQLLKSKDSTNIGNLYVNYIKKDVFNFLYIINKNDTIYSINKNVLSNKEGKDIEVYSKGFYGYKFVRKKNDYFILSALGNEGKNVSDNITIEWNYDKKIFEVFKLP